MLHASLVPHPSTPCPGVDDIHVRISALAGTEMILTYAVSGDIRRLRIPPRRPPRRRDGLWQQTCFEVFVTAEDGPGYREFNFSPSAEWAAYDFHDYRNGRALEDIAAPAIINRFNENELQLEASLSPFALPDGITLRLGLAAVLEQTDGTLSYWALRHPPGKPDFHHADCFALPLELPIEQP